MPLEAMRAMALEYSGYAGPFYCFFLDTWWGEAPERGQDIGNTFGGGTSVYRTLARATKSV
jgi:hypothetical protein